MQEAQSKFDCAMFTEGGSTAEGYRDLLQTLIRDMTRKPDEYTVNRRFVTGLPQDMREAIFDDRLNVEVNTLDEFVESAKAFEVTERSKKEYGQFNPIHVTSSRDKGKAVVSCEAPTRPSRGHMFIRQGGRFFRPMNWEGEPPNRAPPQSPAVTPQPNSPARVVPTGSNDPLRPRNNRPTDLSNIKCFRCGEKGHYASSHDKEAHPRIRAAHTVIGDDIRADDDEAGSMTGNIHSEDDYDNHDQPGWQEVEFEEYSNDYESNDEEVEFMGMMRTNSSEDGSSSNTTDTDEHDEYNTFSEDTAGFVTWYLTSCDFGMDRDDGPTFQHRIRLQKSKALRSVDNLAAMMETPEKRTTTRYKLKIATQLRDRLMYSTEDKLCLSTYIDVNGMSALALWDSGSTSTAMSPHFADISKTLIFNLTEPVTLQLGTVGSRSKINFGTMANIAIAGLNPTEYIDVVNIDRYDILIGTPFMH